MGRQPGSKAVKETACSVTDMEVSALEPGAVNIAGNFHSRDSGYRRGSEKVRQASGARIFERGEKVSACMAVWLVRGGTW
jgi:hypothetical protein